MIDRKKLRQIMRAVVRERVRVMGRPWFSIRGVPADQWRSLEMNAGSGAALAHAIEGVLGECEIGPSRGYWQGLMHG